MSYSGATPKFRLLIVLAALWLVFAAFRESTANSVTRPASPIFEEVSTKVGLNFRHFNGMTGKLFLPEVMGSGAALFDFDHDGDLDGALLLLASGAGSYMAGTTVVVDGGQVVAIRG